MRSWGDSRPKRLAALPEATTFAQQGMKAADSMLWSGLLTPLARAGALQIE